MQRSLCEIWRAPASPRPAIDPGTLNAVLHQEKSARDYLPTFTVPDSMIPPGPAKMQVAYLRRGAVGPAPAASRVGGRKAG